MSARRLSAALFVAFGLVVFSAGPAAAHGTLVRSDPADVSVLDHAPGVVELTFNEAISVDGSTVELIDVDGSVHDAEIVGHGATDLTLLVELGDVPDGLYSLRWSAFSTSDGHVTRGMLVWGFGPGADLAEASFAESAQNASPVEVALRWVLLVGLALVLGGVVVEILVLRALRDRLPAEGEKAWHVAAEERATFWISRGAQLAAVAASLLVVNQLYTVAAATNRGFAGLVDVSLLFTTWGRWALLRVAALAIAALMLSAKGRSMTNGRLAAVAMVGLGLVAHAAGGHAAATDSAVLSIANDLVHLTASIAWLGGVFVLWRVLRLGGAHRTDRITQEALTLFSPFATAAVVVAILTGLLAVGDQVRSVDALIVSLYGRALLVKMFAIGTVLLLALGTRRGRMRQASTPWIAREVMVGSALLLAVAFITATVPGNGSIWLPAVDADARQLATIQDDIQLALSVAPNVPGQNFVLVDAASTRRPVIAPIDRVLVRISPIGIDIAPTTVEATATDPPGAYEVATTQFATSGDYVVEVVIRREGIPDVTSEFAWSVASGPGARDVVVSARELGMWSSSAGAVGAALFLAFMLWRGAEASSRNRRVGELETYLGEDRPGRERVGP